MAPLSTLATEAKKSPAKGKTGTDGLTRNQRYYRNHPEVRLKNRDRARMLRNQKRLSEGQKTTSTSDPPNPTDDIGALNIPDPIKPCHVASASGSPKLSADGIPHLDTRALPADFFSGRQQNRGAAFGHAMQVLQDPRFRDPTPLGTRALDRAERLRHAVLEWGSGWGGVAYWSIGLNASFTNALEEDRVEEWHEQVLNHASVGRRLLAQYTNLSGELPSKTYEIKELWRLTIEMVEMLVSGITVINTRCSVLPHLWQVEWIPPPAWSEESDGEDSASSLGDEAGDELCSEGIGRVES